MKSSVVKRFFGVIISIVLILSSISLITIYAVKDSFTKENLESSLDKLNFKDYLINYSSENYNNFLTAAKSIGLTQAQADEMLQSKAFNSMLAETISDVALGTFDGKNPLVTLSTCLTDAVKRNTEEIMNSIDFDSAGLSPEEEAQLTDAQKAEYETKKQTLIDENKEDFTKSMCDLAESIRAGALQSNALKGMSDYNFSLIKDFILLLKILVGVCILLLFIIFIKNISSALWLGINSFLIALISIIAYAITHMLCDNLGTVLVNALNKSSVSTNILAQIIGCISSSILYTISSSYAKFAGILSITFIILIAIHILLKPARTKLSQSSNNDNFFEEN